jgi:enhancing lycopene biosynthesis protein 2
LHVSISLVPSILAQNVPPLDEICNLNDPTNTDMEGNDCHTDEPNEMHQVLQQSFQFLQYVVISSTFILCPIAIVYAHTQYNTNQEALTCTLEQGHTEVMDNADDVANDEFTYDEDGFMMMTPAVMMSQKIATESAATKVSFTHSMLNMLGDRLHNVPKNC